MNIERLRFAVSILRDDQIVLGARQITYLETYPAMLALAGTSKGDARTRFLQLAAAAYGWMPRVVRIDTTRVDGAVVALAKAAQRTEFVDAATQEVEQIAVCLSSVVGASKVLHFTNPVVFPIWDTKVQRVWGHADPTQDYMRNCRHYVAYATEVHCLRTLKEFAGFATEFREAYSARLMRLGIPDYRISDSRVIESAAFERSGEQYDDN